MASVLPLGRKRIVKVGELRVGTHSKPHLLQWFSCLCGVSCYASITHVYLALRKKKKKPTTSQPAKDKSDRTIWTPWNLTLFWLVLNPSFFWNLQSFDSLFLSKKDYIWKKVLFRLFTNLESVIILVSKSLWKIKIIPLAPWKGLFPHKFWCSIHFSEE